MAMADARRAELRATGAGPGRISYAVAAAEDRAVVGVTCEILQQRYFENRMDNCDARASVTPAAAMALQIAKNHVLVGANNNFAPRLRRDPWDRRVLVVRGTTIRSTTAETMAQSACGALRNMSSATPPHREHASEAAAPLECKSGHHTHIYAEQHCHV